MMSFLLCCHISVPLLTNNPQRTSQPVAQATIYYVKSTCATVHGTNYLSANKRENTLPGPSGSNTGKQRTSSVIIAKGRDIWPRHVLSQEAQEKRDKHATSSGARSEPLDPYPSSTTIKSRRFQKKLPKVSMVNTSLKELKRYLITGFELVTKKETTCHILSTEGTWGCQQHRMSSRTFEVKINQVLSENERLLAQAIDNDIVKTVVNLSVNEDCETVNECQRCLELKTELLNKKDFVDKETYDKLSQSQAKDTVIVKLKEQIKSLNGNVDDRTVKMDMDEIETLNIELEHRVTKLVTENEHLKQTYKQLYDSIKPKRVQSKEQYDALIKQSLPLGITLLRSHSWESTLPPHLTTHISRSCPSINNFGPQLIEVTPRKKDKKVRFAESLTSTENTKPDSTSNIVSNKRVLHSTGVRLSTSASGSQPSGNTKNDRILQTPSSNSKNKVEAHPRNVKSSLNKKNGNVNVNGSAVVQNLKKQDNSDYVCINRDDCMSSDNLCVSNSMNDVKFHAKPKKNKSKKDIWKPTGKVFTQIGYIWRPTGRTFTIVGNACPLTRITTTNEVPSRKPIVLDSESPKPVVKLVYSRKPRKNKNTESVSKTKVGPNRPWRLKPCLGYWHRVYLTLNFGLSIILVARHGLVRGLPKLKFEKDHLCSACALGKSSKKPHKPKSEDTNQEKLYLLHMDLCGPMRVASVSGKKYILVIVDDYSRFTWVKCLRSKDEAPAFIINFLKMIQVRLKETVRRIRTDNGTEFVNQTLREYYEKVGISHETSVARSPQQNGVVERRNRTLIEAARTMLIYAKAPLFLWAEAVATACYTQNRSMIRRRHGKTPYELLHNKPPDLSYLHVFGALCYPTNDSENLGKLQPKADIGIFIGYAPTKKAFRIYNRRIIETIHVDFDELTAMASEHSIDQDAPSPSNSHTTPETPTPIFSHDVEEDNHDIEVAHMSNDPYFAFQIPEVSLFNLHQTNIFAAHDEHGHLPNGLKALLLSEWLSGSYLLFIPREVQRPNSVDTPMVEKSKLDEDKEGKAVDQYTSIVYDVTLLYLTSQIMALSIADQIALDDALVAPADLTHRLGTLQSSLDFDITSKEATLQVVYDVLKLTPNSGLRLMFTIDRTLFRFQDEKQEAHHAGLEQFRDILQICPKVGNKKFVDPPLEKEIIIFLASLGHTGDIRKLSDVNVNKLHQPWRSFAAVINKCLCGTPSYDSLRLSSSLNLWEAKTLTRLKQLKNIIKKKPSKKLNTLMPSGSGEDERMVLHQGVPEAPEL
ncbi:retrovirus-related pol polyprotein from transposon TNT 1-94 [Tanacetum coccineum]|uniref:Retrovirus-related pol polyprotein from transposon TNT 1-94 n=1 Tax=Tanacetum coccineum TaxID=301880 RepID=A0ABQ5GQ69_9ASTR